MKPKFFITTTVARTLFFFSGQPRLWKEVFDVTAIASEKDKLVQFANEEGIGYRFIPMHRAISLWSDMACFLRFIWLFLKERPYVVHGNTPKASLLSMLAAWLTRRPVRIYMCHGLRYLSTQGRLRKVLMVMERLSCNCATHVICVSPGLCKQLVADGLCKENKAEVIGFGTASGIDLERFSRGALNGAELIRERLSIPDNDFVFCFVGRIVKDKGINELVSAFDILSREFKNCHLMLVGAQEIDLDPIDAKTQTLIDVNERIHAVGRQNDVRPWLAASNAFVLPSYREGVGMALLEANAMDLPCISSDIIGCNDIVKEGINGELVKVHSIDALYAKMHEWVISPDKVKRLSKNCRSYVEERFDANVVKNVYFKRYRKISDK